MSFTVRWAKNLVEITLSGTVDLEEIRRYEGEVFGHPDFDLIRGVIWDGRDVTELSLAEDENSVSAAYSKGSSISNANIRLGFVVANEDVRSTAETYIEFSKKMGNPWAMQIFSSRDDAMKWVDGNLSGK